MTVLVDFIAVSGLNCKLVKVALVATTRSHMNSEHSTTTS